MHIASIESVKTVLGRAALTAALVVTAAAPAFALGHRGDSKQIEAARQNGPAPNGPVEAAPEIDGGVAVAAIALVAGGFLIARDRLRR